MFFSSFSSTPYLFFIFSIVTPCSASHSRLMRRFENSMPCLALPGAKGRTVSVNGFLFSFSFPDEEAGEVPVSGLRNKAPKDYAHGKAPWNSSPIRWRSCFRR